MYSERKKLLYDERYIEEEYLKYQSNDIGDTEAIEELTSALNGKEIIVLGLGSSVKRDSAKIHCSIEKKKQIVISVNYEPIEYRCDYVFVSNAKRYSKLSDISIENPISKLIVTSNITTFGRKADFILNYQSLMKANCVGSDNVLLLVIASLIKFGVKEVNIAGFDGFSPTNENYYEFGLSFAGNEKYVEENNDIIRSGLHELSKQIKINFLTASLYEEDTN